MPFVNPARKVAEKSTVEWIVYQEVWRVWIIYGCLVNHSFVPGPLSCFLPIHIFQDGLQLSHWVRESDRDKEYPFAKFNKSIEIMKFTDDEYARHLMDAHWTLTETRQLLDLCQQFDLRFTIVSDRLMSAPVCVCVRR